MPVYIDESGGLSAGVMTMAGVEIEADAAEALLRRFRDITGLRGELKGSRIDMTQRGLFFELLQRHSGRAQVVVARRGDVGVNGAINPASDWNRQTSDLAVYVALLTQLVDQWLPESGGCLSLVVDEGRYDSGILGRVRNDIARMLTSCGRAQLSDSKASAGVQVADVVANTVFNTSMPSDRAHRIGIILAPFLENHIVRLSPLRVPVAKGA